MAGSVNKVILVGNTGADPEVRSMQDGREMATFSLATSDSWKDRDGNRQEKTDWHRVTIFKPGLVGIVKQYVKKEDKLCIEGQLRTDKYTDKSGIERYSTQVVLSGYQATLTLLGGSRNDGGQWQGGGSDGGSVNKVILLGNAGADPEARTMQNGDEMALLSIATNESWKDRDGNRQEKTEWHRIVIFKPDLVGIVKQYVKKGAKLYIEGQSRTRKYTDKSGIERYSTEVVLSAYNSSLTMLDIRQGGGGSGRWQGGGSDGGGTGGSSYDGGAGSGSSGDGFTSTADADFDDDIPF